jgi:hypothetical protein
MSEYAETVMVNKIHAKQMDFKKAVLRFPILNTKDPSSNLVGSKMFYEANMLPILH